jgi:hypothetical protein
MPSRCPWPPRPGGWFGRRYAQRGQPLLLFLGEFRPAAALPLEPFAEVVPLVEDAGGDVGQVAAWFVGGEFGQDAVVALPVQWPGAVPVRADRGQLRGPRCGALRVLAEAVFSTEVGHVLPDRCDAAGHLVSLRPSALRGAPVEP